MEQEIRQLLSNNGIEHSKQDILVEQLFKIINTYKIQSQFCSTCTNPNKDIIYSYETMS